MNISTPGKVGIVCLLLRLKPRDTVIILVAHYISHQVL
jgi:hypothetical protein